MVNYKEDWKFNKFSKLLYTKKEKERLYDLYKNLSSSSKKRLYLYLLYDKSLEIIRNLLLKDGLLTINGIDNYLFKNNNLFQSIMIFECSDKSCENSTGFESTKYLYKKCPKCKNSTKLINRDNLFEYFQYLYLNYFDFYILNDVDTTLYLIYNKYNGKTYLKKGDEALSNWIYLKLISNNCDVDKFLFLTFGSVKNQKTQLLQLLKEYGFIKHIDNINFKPTLEKTFKEEDKSFFNIYSGNKYLNSNGLNKEIDIKIDCSNIYELLFNLTGKDDEGVDYLLNVLAMILQEPYIKTKQLIIFYGEEASGKGTFYDFILKPLLEGYIIKILGKKIKSSFNPFLSKKLALVLEEVKADKDEEDTLKEIVTEELLLINEKNMPERYENNYLTIFGFSNEQNPISAGKRRGVYFRSRTLGGSISKAPDYRKKYEKQIPKEFDLFVKYLKNKKYNRVEIMKGYETDAKKQVQEQNMSTINKFYEELCNYNSIGKYVSELIVSGKLDNIYLDRYLFNFEEIQYVQAEFLLILYNSYLYQQRYKQITLNKFSEFWQLIGIDRNNKTHWRRLINPDNEKKTQYVNLDIINKEIKRRYNQE